MIDAYNPHTRRYEHLVVGAAYQIHTHDESACMDGDCGGIIDRGVMTYVASRFLGTDKYLGDIYSHSFRDGGDGETEIFREDVYSLTLRVPGPPTRRPGRR